MKITFLTPAPYWPNGFDCKYGVIGETRDVPSIAASLLIRDGNAVSAEKQQTPQEAMDEVLAGWKANACHAHA